MQRIVCEGKGNGEEQRADVLREKERSGRERKRGREAYLGRAEERPRTGSEASQRRRDRRRQPAITSWNVWERVGLDPKGPTTTKSLPPLARLILSSASPATPVRPLPLYRMTPRKRWDYLPIVRRSRCDHVAYLIREMHAIY